VVFGGTAASSALTYVSTFPSEAARQQVAATTSADTGLATLLGPVSAIGTVGGYTVYKGFAFLTTIGAVWAILAATRVLRGEEDAGRWQLMLAGGTRPSRATAATLGALGGAIVIVFFGTTLIVALAGRNPDLGFGVGETMFYGLSITIAPAVFAAVGAVTSQLSRTRRLATGLGISVLGVSFVLRMIADSNQSARWLLWTTPFGWTELMRPFSQNDPWPLVPATVTVLGLGAASVALASRRDAGDGLLTSRDVSALRPFGLRRAAGLAARLELPVLAAWCLGAVATGFVLGIIAKLTTASIPSSMSNTLEKFGMQGSFAKQYFGIAFLLVAAMIAIVPAGQLGAAADEELSRRLLHILARPARRASWFAGRLAISAAGVVATGLLAGIAAWLGSRSQGVDVGLLTMIGAGLNIVPTALVALGIGAVVLSVAPRAAAGTVYAVVTWSLIVDLLGSMVSEVSWLEHVSLFHYLALAPAQNPEPRTLGTSLAIAVGLCFVATLVFGRRDLRST
jgi:ABC-2 type transport system permease protein